jgi:hypothetical protein
MTSDGKKLIRDWRRRWAAVNEWQTRELRALSDEDRARQLADLFRFAASLPADTWAAREDRVVRLRWNRLRRRWAEGG